LHLQAYAAAKALDYLDKPAVHETMVKVSMCVIRSHVLGPVTCRMCGFHILFYEMKAVLAVHASVTHWSLVMAGTLDLVYVLIYLADFVVTVIESVISF